LNENKTILITGTSSGFGKLTAQTLAKDKHTVYASMRGVAEKNSESAKSLEEWAKKEGAKLKVIELDVTDQSSVDKAVESIISTEGKIDVVVNNAGIFGLGLTEAFTIEQFKKIFEVNTLGPLRVNRAVLPQMRKQNSGLLIQISSVVGRVIIPFAGAYTASKFAVEAIAETYNMELKPLGIESVIIEPGAYPTEIMNKIIKSEDEERLSQYGDMAKAPDKMFEGFMEMLKGENAPKPQAIADAVKKLVDMESGKRPLRTVADAMTGQIVEELNKSSAKSQDELIKAFEKS